MVVISELKSRNSCVGSEKEKQVFFFSHTPCNLVSDDPGTSQYNIGTGTTLPYGTNATHNAGLSPLYVERSGTIGHTFPKQILGRGEEGTLWSSTALGPSDSYRFFTAVSVTSLSAHFKILGSSLRCLISTKRQASE